MKIGILSDTHGFLDEKIFKHFAPCDEIWHAGDIGHMEIMEKLEKFKPIRAVYGNIDGQDIRLQYPKNQYFVCQGLNVWMTHIGGKPPRYTPEITGILQKNIPQIFICGHSHMLCVMRDAQHAKLLYINPGAAGRYGFHKVRTLVRFDIQDGCAGNMQVIELGERA